MVVGEGGDEKKYITSILNMEYQKLIRSCGLMPSGETTPIISNKTLSSETRVFITQ